MTTPTGTPTRVTEDDRPVLDPRIRQRRVAIRRREGRRRLTWVVAVVVVVAVVAAGWGLLHTGWFSADAVTVEGPHPQTSTAAILGAAHLEGRPPLISVNSGADAARVEALPYIASAQVSRHWPDGVTVTVTERVPTLVMAGPGSSWSILDGDGRTLQVVTARPAGLVVLVVHTDGGGMTPARVGHTLAPEADGAVTVCRTLPAAFAAQVVSVTAAPDGTISLDLNSGITVQLGAATDLDAKYEDVASIIAHASLIGAKVIDVSVPQSPTVTS
jgi:cell division protein FtsQ